MFYKPIMSYKYGWKSTYGRLEFLSLREKHQKELKSNLLLESYYNWTSKTYFDFQKNINSINTKLESNYKLLWSIFKRTLVRYSKDLTSQ